MAGDVAFATLAANPFFRRADLWSKKKMSGAQKRCLEQKFVECFTLLGAPDLWRSEKMSGAKKRSLEQKGELWSTPKEILFASRMPKHNTVGAQERKCSRTM